MEAQTLKTAYLTHFNKTGIAIANGKWNKTATLMSIRIVRSLLLCFFGMWWWVDSQSAVSASDNTTTLAYSSSAGFSSAIGSNSIEEPVMRIISLSIFLNSLPDDT